MKIFFLLVLLGSFSLFAQNTVFNEAMSSNVTTIADEDGDYSDWIELFNNQTVPADLTGYGISDDASSPYKWIMPSYILDPHSHLLLFASGKDKKDYVTHWETIITWGAVWKYFPGTTEPPASWKLLEFNDASWQSGKSGFGYGDGDDSTIVSPVQSLYIRKIFTIDSLSDVQSLCLHVDYDDAFVAYLNGVEIARANIGTAGIPPLHNESASSAAEAVIYQGGRPGLYEIQNFRSLLRQGNNVITIQVHNYGTNSSDMTLIPFLTLGLNKIPANALGKHPLLDLPVRNLHTNFRINASGDTLFLTSPDGLLTDRMNIPFLTPDVSYGRKPDGSNNYVLFSEPTPGDSNLSQGASGMAGEPVFSLQSGFYQGNITVTLSPSSPGNIVRYTLDGTDPGDTSSQFLFPLTLSSTKVVRAKEFNTNLIPGRTVTNTYFINFSTSLPVMSLSTKPGNFFDIDYGIYVMGDSADPNIPYYGANFWQDWERPIHIEMFDNDGGRFSADAGVKIFGGWTRSFDQKSLAVYFREEYGYNNLEYELFKNIPLTKFDGFVLRNAGNDWQQTLLRDPLSTTLVEPLGIEKQAYRPVVVFINGQYWGIQDLREKVNEHFLADHHNLDADSIDLLQDDGKVVNGSNTDYMSLYNFISGNSMAVQSNYEYVNARMDIENFISYYAAQIYIANRDWPGANIKFWRKSGSGKWRFIMYDTDFGFGLYDEQGYAFNSLDFATAVNGPTWPNPPWSTLILRKLLENISFRNDFINRLADLSNSIFRVQNVYNTITTLKSGIEPEISRHSSRWNQFTYQGWINQLSRVYDFANRRPGYMKAHILQKFSLPGTQNVNLFISDTAKGRIKLNSLTISAASWTGLYYMNVPVTISAQPKRGYRFVRWQGSLTSSDDTLTISLTDNLNLTAEFETDNQFSAPSVVINEINYNSSLSFNSEDWVELYNNSDTTVNLSGWQFRDEDDAHIYTFPQGTLLNARGYTVLVRDSVLFRSHFPDIANLHFINFGFSGNSELLRLFDDGLYIIDSLTYRDSIPWPVTPDGNGPTLSLKNPSYDNSDPLSWGASLGFGTPGQVNDNLTDLNDTGNPVPVEFLLYQNYPNPFNPETKIRFALPNAEMVTLKIYNMLGEEISTAVKKEYLPGSYEITFNASGLSSGIYFYRLTAGAFSMVKKMQVLK